MEEEEEEEEEVVDFVSSHPVSSALYKHSYSHQTLCTQTLIHAVSYLQNSSFSKPELLMIIL